MIYHTRDGEMLDWICWRHYGQRSRLDEAASQMEPRLKQGQSSIGDDVLALGKHGQGDMRRIVEMVLEANPGLADHGTVFSAGVSIDLPDISPDTEASNAVHLWD